MFARYFDDSHVVLFESSSLEGLTGENGESYCVFINIYKNPLNSGWRWFFDVASAMLFIDVNYPPE